MSICTDQAKALGQSLVRSLEDITKPVIAIKTTFETSAGYNEIEPLFLYNYIRGAIFLVPAKKKMYFSKMNTVEDIKSFLSLEENLRAEEQYSAALARFTELYPTYHAFKTAINDINKIVEGMVIAPSAAPVVKEEAVAATEKGALQLSEKIERSNVDMSISGTEIFKRKAERVQKMEEIKETSSDYWVPFLTTYFPGASSLSTAFIEWARDIFYDRLIDKTNKQQGFIENINFTINDIKEEVEKQAISRRQLVARAGINVDEDIRNADLTTDEGKNSAANYFYEVLNVDFDFVLKNLIRSIVVSKEDTDRHNHVVTGFVNEDGEPLKPITLNLPADVREYLFTRLDGENKYAFKTEEDGYEAVNNVLEKVDTDGVTFSRKRKFSPSTFYLTTVDQQIYFSDVKGESVKKVTPETKYSYNSKSNRNTNSFDPFVGALDSDTSFIHSLFTMFRRVDNIDNKLIFGSRMGIKDFLTLAPHLVNAGSDHKKFLDSLKTLAKNTESEAGRLANTMLIHVFSETPTLMGDGTQVYSINSAAKKFTRTNGTINHNIINALHAAFINKAFIKYLTVEDYRGAFTKGLNTNVETDNVNLELADVLMDRRYTKNKISDMIIVDSVANTYKVRLLTGMLIDPNTLDSIDAMREATHALGINTEFEKIYARFASVYSVDLADRYVIDIFKNIIRVAAVNKRKSPIKITKEEKKGFKHPLYITMPPTTIISGEGLRVLASVYNVDTHKNVRIGGVSTGTLSTPNREDRFETQLGEYNYYNENVNTVKIKSNPYISGTIEEIPKATYLGKSTKAPIVKKGELFGLSEWDEKIREEHAMIHGFLTTPKNVGTQFSLQPVNYSDKGNPSFYEIAVSDFNALSNKKEDFEILKASYIAYQAQRYEDLQRMVIYNWKNYVLGNFNNIYDKIIAENTIDTSIRLQNLVFLKEILLRDYTNLKGDFTKAINLILEKVAINPDDIEHSDSNMDKHADYFTFPGASKVAVMRPHMGIRAEVYRDPEMANEEIEAALEFNRGRLADLRVNSNKDVSDALNRVKQPGIIKNVESFYDRVYLINGIYGHSLKTLIVGDESTFPVKYKQRNVSEYYELSSKGEIVGLEEGEFTMSTQFKRAQSVLTRGNSYAQKETMAGYKRRAAKDNVIQYLETFGKNVAEKATDVSHRTLKDTSYEFPELMGKTITELEGLGVISRFSDGNLIYKTNSGYVFNFNVGKDKIVVPAGAPFTGNSTAYPVEFRDALSNLAKVVIENTMASPAEIALKTLDVPLTRITIPHSLVLDVPGRERQISLNEYIEKIDSIREDLTVVMPDLIPSMTIDDPISYVNILNAMGVKQENSDGVQFIHPLMSLILNYARGNELAAFNTKSNTALKVLTTTFFYDQARQTLQKKSIQMPFTKEQMSKVGGIELYNALVKMNSSIRFKQPEMTYTLGTIGNLRTSTVKANNLQELFETMANNSQFKYEADDSVIWKSVFEVLAQNPINLYSFVGLLTLPSGQKTGHKKVNRNNSVFSKTRNTDKSFIDYTANDFSFEVLTKDHDYDVISGKQSGATISLLSQLVNSIAFGGLSDSYTEDLQEAMASKMMVNRIKIGDNLYKIALQHAEEANADTKRYFIDVAKKFKALDFEAGKSPVEKWAHAQVLRTSLSVLEDGTLDKKDSELIAEIIRGTKTVIGKSGKEVTLKNVYSLDAPSVRSKIMQSLRATFYKDVIKMKMNGFQAVATSSNKTIVVYKLPDGRSITRYGYIKYALQHGLADSDHIHSGPRGQVVELTPENYAYYKDMIIPYDNVKYVYNQLDSSGKAVERLRPFGNVTDEGLSSSEVRIFAVITPDVTYSPLISSEKLANSDENAMFIYTDEKGKKKPMFNWYLKETLGLEKMYRAAAAGNLSEDAEEKFGLVWYDYVNGDINIKDTREYRNFYRVLIKDNHTDEDIESLNYLRAMLIAKLQEKDTEGKNVWSSGTAQVVLPTYMATAYGIKKGTSLYDIIGVDGADEANAVKYFSSQLSTKLMFNYFMRNKKYSVAKEKLKYTRKAGSSRSPFNEEMRKYISDNEAGEFISIEGMKALNLIISKYHSSYIANKAKNFIKSLKTVFAHVPGQGKQSAFVGVTLEFLDAQGNAAFAPTEHMVTTGGDFDIDTFSVLTQALDVLGNIVSLDDIPGMIKDPDGKVNIEASYKADILEAERKGKFLYDSLSAEEKENTDIAKFINSATKEVHTTYQNLLSNMMFDAISGSLTNVDAAVEANTPISMEMFGTLMSNIEKYNEKKVVSKFVTVPDYRYTREELENAQLVFGKNYNLAASKLRGKEEFTFDNPFTYTNEEGKIQVEYPYVLKEGDDIEKLNQQFITELYREWLISKHRFSHHSTMEQPINLYTTRPAQRKFIKQKINSGALDKSFLFVPSDLIDTINYSSVLVDLVKKRKQRYFSGEDYSSIFTFEDLAAQGKDSIGVFATALKMLSSVHVSKINWDRNYKQQYAGKIKDPFTFLNNIDYLDFSTSENVKKYRTTFADLDRFNIAKDVAKSPELQQKIITLLAGTEEFDKKGMQVIINVLKSEIDRNINIATKNKIEAVKILSMNLFGIAIPNDFVVTNNYDDFLKAYYSMLTKNPALVGKAFSNVIGKQLSDNVASQFLSAATDNAKELILGKIKSNQLTNGTITVMLLLGYDTKDIIYFLYDPFISDIFDKLSAKVSNLEKVKITEKVIREVAGTNSAKPSVLSLIKLLNISSQVHVFRAVRSLNEANKVESYDVDSILSSLSPNLYKAIQTDNISILASEKKEAGQDVFDPNLMVFLHKQSRALYVNMYEAELMKMRALFKTLPHVSKLAEGATDGLNAYKASNAFFSDLQVESFFNKRVPVFNPETGKSEDKYRQGDVYKENQNGVLKRTKVDLYLEANREEFVKNFRTYINVAKKELADLKKTGNAALDQLGTGNTYKSASPVVYIPMIKNTHADSVDVSIIVEGINELKVVTGNKDIDQLQAEIYSNLSHYALIVSSGEFKKGTMIESFKEINLALSEHVNTLTEANYNAMTITSPTVKELINGGVKFLEDIKIKRKYKNIGDFEQIDDVQYEDDVVDLDVMESFHQDEYENQDQEDGHQTRIDPDKARFNLFRARVFEGTNVNVGQIFKLNDYRFKDEYFYPFAVGEVAYRIFKKETPEALAVTTLQSEIKINSIDEAITRDIAKTIYQIGLSATYNGEPIRVLAYAGLEGPENNRYQVYLITSKDGLSTVPGVHLMNQNPNLLFSGNEMGPVTSYNKTRAVGQQKENEKALEVVPNISTAIKKEFHMVDYGYFTIDQLKHDPIVSKETKVLGSVAKDVINVGNKENLNSPTIKEYAKQDTKYRWANEGSINTLIPSFITYRDAINTNIPDENMYYTKVMDRIFRQFNYADVGTTISFHGIENKDGKTKIDGGINILKKALKDTGGLSPISRGNEKGAAGYLNDDYLFKSSTNVYNGITTYTFTRRKKTAMIANTIYGFEVVKTSVSAKTKAREVAKTVTGEKEISEQAILLALNKGYIDSMYSTTTFDTLTLVGKPFETSSKSENMLLVPIGKDEFRVFVYRMEPETQVEKYIELVKDDAKKGTFGTDNLSMYISSKQWKELEDLIYKRREDKNKTC